MNLGRLRRRQRRGNLFPLARRSYAKTAWPSKIEFVTFYEIIIFSPNFYYFSASPMIFGFNHKVHRGKACYED